MEAGFRLGLSFFGAIGLLNQLSAIVVGQWMTVAVLSKLVVPGPFF